ncbi:MAG: class B sortase [Clostridia bacterium]|nr:class B sortase [Clostridia bacterium]
MKQKNSKDKKILYRFILFIRIILIIIIIYCLIYIISWYIENKKNATILADLANSSIKDTITIQVPVSTENNDLPEETTNVTVYELDFDKLLSINSSTVGWLKVPNTSIDYPVVKGNDNNYYLSHSFDNTKNTAGWIFADYRNKFDGTDKNIIIYGHNRVDSSMFATLKNTQKDYWYNNDTNKYITLTTPNGTNVYEVFSVYTKKMESYYITTDFSNDDEYLNFLNTIKSRSIHDFGVSLNSSDSILTLSTCDATGKSRVVVHAKKIM